MNSSFLDTILESTRARVEREQSRTDFAEVRRLAQDARSNTSRFRFSEALSMKDGVNIIAEIKRASPSKGLINGGVDVLETARSYQSAGAAAMSVLTEESFFQGSLDDLRTARSAVNIPILRKDFTVDDYQIYEAAAAGADAVLLIVAALTPNEISTFQTSAENLGLDAIVEVHNLDELKTAVDCGATIIGVNNRNLRTFEVSLDVSRELAKYKPAGVLMIAESGISTAEEIAELKDLSFDGLLVGETLMRSTDPGSILKEWM
jgi:indole-3-glycerol phosphate synthase